MVTITNQNGKITIMNGKIIELKTQSSPTPKQVIEPIKQTNWINHTKTFADKNNISYTLKVFQKNNLKTQYIYVSLSVFLFRRFMDVLVSFWMKKYVKSTLTFSKPKQNLQ